MLRAILFLAIGSLMLCQCVLKAQDGGLAPFTSATGRFMLFDHGRFVEHGPRLRNASFPMATGWCTWTTTGRCGCSVPTDAR